ncbi:MAG TPA: adenylate/guanylate cyclase domain-containing protein [Nocardioidaceae bacterium]|nr:adenylate/guanylate cyclase domain-containing protein [Nocardioidaceae bacterium]
MLDRLMRRLYDALGSRYWLVLVVGEGGASVLVAAVTVAMIATYYDPTPVDALLVGGVAVGMTLLAVIYATMRAQPVLDAIVAWRRNPTPTPKETVDAWDAATNFTFRQYRRDSATVSVLAIVPTCATAALLWGIGWAGFWAAMLACIIPAAYATVLSYSVGEVLTRPLVADIAAVLPDDFPFTASGLPVAKRLKLSLPVYTSGTGVLTIGLITNEHGSRNLVIAILVSAAVGIVLSHELTVLLSESITRPMLDVREKLARVREGDYDARVPVISSDELGELAHDFNLMARGLQEREEMRAAFGTYVDKEVVNIILSGQFPQEGVEVEVSILFCDVRGFTTYAEQAEATEVIATLNELFSAMVPIVEGHGGHVDKFMGDGMLAVFGAPEVFPDHADRALAAAVEIVAVTASGLTVAAGVNTGRVVAGPIGGAGRLNFSVIGDAVNIAARVEAATRQTGDDVLITAATRAMLTREHALVSRGSLPLKGKSEPIEVFAPDQGLDERSLWGRGSSQSAAAPRTPVVGPPAYGDPT